MSAEPNTQRWLEWPNYGPVNVGTWQLESTKQKREQVQQERERSLHKSRRLWQALLLAIASTSGCSAYSPTISPSAQIPANLSAPCPQLPPLPNGSSAMLFLWVRDVIAEYHDCAARFDAYREAVR